MNTPMNSGEVLKATVSQSLILESVDGEKELYLRICKCDVFIASSELMKTAKVAIPVPLASFQGGVLKALEVLRLVQEDVEDATIPLTQLRYWNPTLSAFVKFTPSTKLTESMFLMDCLDVVWEDKPKKDPVAETSPMPVSLKQNFSLIEDLEFPLSNRVQNLENRLNITNEKLESLISALAQQGVIAINPVEIYESFSEDSLPTLKSIAPGNRTISAPGFTNLNSSRLPTSMMEGIDQSQISFDKKKLHFAVLYSHPLLEVNVNPGAQKETLGILQNDPVNFSVECDSILKTIQDKKKMVNVHIESASQEKFIKMIRDKPTVLHVMCHGSYDNKSKEFFLEFENEYSALLRLTPKILRECLQGQDLSSIRLVFLNACHSEVSWGSQRASAESSSSSV